MKAGTLVENLRGSEACRIDPLIEPEAGEEVLEKRVPSGFFGSGLADRRRGGEVDTVVVCGTSTSGCVRATVVDGLSDGFRVIVPEDCVSDPSAPSAEAARPTSTPSTGTWSARPTCSSTWRPAGAMPVADQFDLVIRHGRVVTAASDGVADIGIVAGRVAALGERLGPGRAEIDASGTLVFPGGIDAHVHLTPVTTAQRSLAWADDFASGSRAAAAGGITTVGNITFPAPGETLLQAHRRVRAEAEAASVTDFFLHPVLLEPGEDRLGESMSLPGPA